jgi:hypothetical protein
VYLNSKSYTGRIVEIIKLKLLKLYLLSLVLDLSFLLSQEIVLRVTIPSTTNCIVSLSNGLILKRAIHKILNSYGLKDRIAKSVVLPMFSISSVLIFSLR